MQDDVFEELSELIGENQSAVIHATCMDCHKDFDIRVERTGPKTMDIQAGAIYKTRDEWEFKCQECFEYNPNKGPKMLIYSRVVGYMRPVSDWNNAKREEFKMRKKYDMPAGERITAKESRYVKSAVN